MSDKMASFWEVVNSNLDVGDMGNTVSNVPLGDTHTLVITGGMLCDSAPDDVNLGDLSDFQKLQITLHDSSGSIVPADSYPAMARFSEVIYERYPNTHIGSHLSPEDIADILLHVGAITLERTLH